MRVFIFALLIAFVGVSISTPQNFGFQGTLDSIILDPCSVYADVAYDFRVALYEFSIRFYRTVAVRNNLNIVYSPLSLWMILAAMSEGADPYTQQQLFELLNLPYDACTRQKYYHLATSHIVFSDDVKVISNRALLIDEAVTPNPTWYDLIVKNKLLDVYTGPIRYNPVLIANEVKKMMSAGLSTLNLNGNSVLLDSMDYNGLWTSEFPDTRVEKHAPFYNALGYPIGFVDLMRVKKRVRMGFVPSLKAKILELPVGSNGRFKMVFIMFLETNDVHRAVGRVTTNFALEMFDSLQESYVPIEIAIPRVVMTSEIDVRALLEDLGVTTMWNDPAATRYVSHPPALPSSVIQRATLSLDQHGVSPSPVEQDPPHGTPTGLDPRVGKEFIANRSFLSALFDSETLTCLMVTSYSVPTYQH